jgi:hypothetical protein
MFFWLIPEESTSGWIDCAWLGINRKVKGTMKAAFLRTLNIFMICSLNVSDIFITVGK